MKSLKKKLFAITMVLCLCVSTVQPVTSCNVTAKAKKVYITPTGSKYHRKKCGRGRYYKVTLKKAKSYGLTKCKRCYK